MTTEAQVKGFEVDLDQLEDAGTKITHQVNVIEDEEGNPVSGFYIVGKDSEEYQEVANQIRIENIKRAAKRKKQIDATTDDGAAVIAKTVDSSDRKTALAVTVGWFGFNQNAQPMEFNKLVLEKMFNKYPTWQEKILNDLEVQANFTKALLKA